MARRTAIGMTLVLLTVMALAACGGGGDDAAALEGKTWVLRSYGGQAVLAGSEVTLEFDGTEGSIGGIAGCNNYFGGYEASGGDLSFSAIASTEMFCMDPEGVMDQESVYLAALGSAERFEVDGTTLRIYYAGDQVLVFEEQ
jgi:heat shock protein HslJ